MGSQMDSRRENVAVVVIGMFTYDVDSARSGGQEERAGAKMLSEQIDLGIVHGKVGAF